MHPVYFIQARVIRPVSFNPNKKKTIHINVRGLLNIKYYNTAHSSYSVKVEYILIMSQQEYDANEVYGICNEVRVYTMRFRVNVMRFRL